MFRPFFLSLKQKRMLHFRYKWIFLLLSAFMLLIFSCSSPTQELTTGDYSYAENTPLSDDNSSAAANYARAGVLDVLLGGADPTGGAVYWDGTDFLEDGVTHGKFRDAMSISISGDHFNAYQQGVNSFLTTTTHTSLLRSNVYLPANAPNGPVTIPDAGLTFRDDYGWMGGDFYGEGSGRYYHYNSTGAQGATIFWSITPGTND